MNEPIVSLVRISGTQLTPTARKQAQRGARPAPHPASIAPIVGRSTKMEAKYAPFVAPPCTRGNHNKGINHSRLHNTDHRHPPRPQPIRWFAPNVGIPSLQQISVAIAPLHCRRKGK